jgi:hypothetical protein
LKIEIDEDSKKYKNIQSKSRVEKLQSLTEQLHDKVVLVGHELVYLKTREDQFRFTSDSISSSLFYLNLIQVGVIIVVALFQIYNLKSFYEKKKLV